METCPYCGGQLISCGHFELLRKGEETKGIRLYRIPFVQVPNMCALCGELWPNFFTVPDSEWKKYVIPELQKKILCMSCYEKQKTLFPEGWHLKQ